MEQARKIAMVVKKFSSHKEAEENDEQRWRQMTAEERLQEWVGVYDMYFRLYNKGKGISLEKVVNKTTINGS